MAPLGILAISGSLRSGSFNTALLRAVKERAPDTLDIGIITPKGLPIYDGDEESAHGIPPAVEELVEITLAILKHAGAYFSNLFHDRVYSHGSTSSEASRLLQV